MPAPRGMPTRLHRPTVAFIVLVATSLLIPIIKHDGELSSQEFMDLLVVQAKAAVPTNWDEVLSFLPMATFSLLALAHTVAHDFMGLARSDGYRQWTAFTRYCESRIIMNLMAASSLYASLSDKAQEVESTMAAGFNLEASNLLSVAMVVQHYLLAHPRISKHSILYTLLTILMWGNIAAQMYRMAFTSTATDVLQSLFLTKAVWHAYMPTHFATTFEPWVQLARSPQDRQALATQYLEAAHSEAYAELKQEEGLELSANQV